MTLPRFLLPAAIAGLCLLVLPLAAVLIQVPWSEVPTLLTSEQSRTAAGLSLRTATTSTALCLLMGAPLALVMARAPHRIAAVLRALVFLPLVLPPVVSGLALLAAFGRTGLLGGHLETAGLQIAYSTVAVILAQIFVALPFLVLSVEGAVRSRGRRQEEAAATLGASPARVLGTVTLPLLAPALTAGTMMAFARCLGEFGATLTFAGSLPGVSRTLPLEIYLQRESDPDAALALSLVLMLVALVVIAATAGRRQTSTT